MQELAKLIREIPDFPKPGILYYDITTLLSDKDGFKKAVDAMAAPYKDAGIDRVVGVEARGFIFASALAYLLDAGLTIVRKPGKLPYKTIEESYALEYGTDSLQIHEDAIEPGQKVLIVDDLLATGGTVEAVARLVEKVGGKIVGLAFMVELDFLKGREKLPGHDLHVLVHY